MNKYTHSHNSINGNTGCLGYKTWLLVGLVGLLVFGCEKAVAQDTITLYRTGESHTFLMKQDTIRVMMLCSDTTKQKYPGANKLRKADGYTVEIVGVDKYRVPYVWWMFGYWVKGPKTTIGFPAEPLITNYYLNDKKQAVSPNVIVWQHMEITPKEWSLKAF